MIHRIKVMYNDGHGLSARGIARELGISRNTVNKYLKLTEEEIAKRKADGERMKKLDAYRSDLIELLQRYPRLSAVKVRRKLQEKVAIEVSARSMRRYLQRLKAEVSLKQARYYEPVLDMIPGEQCQVDGGELRGVWIGEQERTVYLTVFVLSYSRLMHVSVARSAVDTDTFIRHHDAAFRYFGGRPEECVYDQSKLVVIQEVFRELTLNERFHHYATAAGFGIRACEGYDPESKGKVEAGVKYVKYNGLYGERFANWSALESYLADWLDRLANRRIHGTTGEAPWARYEREERAQMRAYGTPTDVLKGREGATRKVDKTGLIAWQANKYSVPMAYQGSRVGVQTEDSQLVIRDLNSGERLATHPICSGSGQMIKNRHHYRDLSQRVDQLEAELHALIGEPATRLCTLLKAGAPKIYKDQLAGAQQVLQAYHQQHGPLTASGWVPVLDTPCLTATRLRERLDAYGRGPSPDERPTERGASRSDTLARYGALHGQPAGPGGCHDHP